METDKKNKIKKYYAKELSKNSDQREAVFYSFIRQILILSTTILGILITLKKNRIVDSSELYFFMITIVLFGLCILIGLTLLYGHIRIFDKTHKAYVEHRNKLLSGDKSNDTLIFVPTGNFFLVIEKLYYVLFGLSICSLIAYGYFAYS